MRTLVLCGDKWHPAHIAREGLGKFENRGFEFSWLEDTGQWRPEQFTQYPLIVHCKANQISETDDRPWMTAEIEQNLLAHVRRGNGLLVIHAGSAGYDQWPGLRGLMGGAFIEHPEQCPVTVEPQKEHALTTGCTPFTLTDEHYFMALDDFQADVFLTATSEHGSQPAGWTRLEREGRVCVLTPSHHLAGWLHPSFQKLLANALGWCSKNNYSHHKV